MLPITDYNEWNGIQYKATWQPAPYWPPREETTQASGLCFTDTGCIVLVGDKNLWTIPVGHPHKNEQIKDTLIREVWEEARARVTDCHYLGCQKVEPVHKRTLREGQPLDEGGLHYQTRFWAHVELQAFEPNDEVDARALVQPDDVLGTLNWPNSNIIRAVLEAAVAYNTAHH